MSADRSLRFCVPIAIKPEGGGNYFLWNFLAYLKRQGMAYTDRIDDGRYDVLFASHWLVPPETIRRAKRSNPGLRVVHRIDGAAQDYGRNPQADRVQRQVNLLADLTVFQSQYCRRSTRELFLVIAHDGPIIHNPVDVEQFRPDGERVTFPEPVTVCCATWSTNPRKGLQSVYDAAAANPDIGFVLCGRYPDAPRLPNVHMMGVLDRRTLATIMRSCTAFVTFSEREACPNVVLEALASGLPVLYKPSGASPELVGECGLPVELADFRTQLDRVVADRAKLSRLARERAVSRFSPERVFPLYIGAIREALARPPAFADPALVVFLTRGMSLRRWDEAGVLEREVALYRRLRPHIGPVAFVSYGNRRELDYRARLDGMGILCNRWSLPAEVYRWLLPFLHWQALSKAAVFKTNQTYGAGAALWAKRFHRQAKLVARSGYVWSWNAERAAQGRWSWERWRARRLERALFRRADAIVVTAEAGKQYLLQRYAIPAERIQVIPNYVDTSRFAPAERRGSGRRLIFVGRLHPEKNLIGLLEAVSPMDNVELVLIGDGPLRPRLEQAAAAAQARIAFLGARPHGELPEQLSRADAFILPSFYENHPKALLEAMACGLPVIGTDVPGIRELIRHRDTGYLCATSPEGIRAAIREVLGNAALRAEMGRRAREVAEQSSLERALEQELALLRRVMGEPCPS